jgi:alpha-D-ribose 1-methylphosphonate 5-phosphate C-P lyase
MKITATRIKEIIREELSRVNEAMSREAAEDGASMYNSEHYGLSHRQLVQMIMKHGHIDAAYPTYLEFRDGHEHNRGDYVEDSEDVDFDTERRRMKKPMMEEEK